MFDDGPGSSSRLSRGSDIGSRYAHHAGADITTSLQTFGTLPRRSKKRSSTTNSEHRNSSGPSTSGRDAASAPLETHFYYQVSLFWCVFRPAFECCTHPKVGWNTFFLAVFNLFLLILNLLQWFHVWNQEKHLKMNKKKQYWCPPGARWHRESNLWNSGEGRWGQKNTQPASPKKGWKQFF